MRGSRGRNRSVRIDRLLAEALTGWFDPLLVWKLDRLARSLQHLLRVLSDLGSWGVGFGQHETLGSIPRRLRGG